MAGGTDDVINCRCIQPDDNSARVLECIGGPWDGKRYAIEPHVWEIEVVTGPIGYIINRPDGREATYLPAPIVAGHYRRVIGPQGYAVSLNWEPAP